MSANNKNKYMTPFVIGASDLSFILLFFFIMIGAGVQKIEKIEMPFKTSDVTSEVTEAPFRVEIYADSENTDFSRMAVIFTSEEPDTLFLSIGRKDLAGTEAFSNIRDNMASFITAKGVNPDSTSIDVYSSAYSYYGLIAITLAACNQLEYPCNLVYKTEET
jgi:hypothetical protein